MGYGFAEAILADIAKHAATLGLDAANSTLDLELGSPFWRYASAREGGKVATLLVPILGPKAGRLACIHERTILEGYVYHENALWTEAARSTDMNGLCLTLAAAKLPKGVNSVPLDPATLDVPTRAHFGQVQHVIHTNQK
jgi:hypothetical protein